MKHFPEQWQFQEECSSVVSQEEHAQSPACLWYCFFLCFLLLWVVESREPSGKAVRGMGVLLETARVHKLCVLPVVCVNKHKLWRKMEQK